MYIKTYTYQQKSSLIRVINAFLTQTVKKGIERNPHHLGLSSFSFFVWNCFVLLHNLQNAKENQARIANQFEE